MTILVLGGTGFIGSRLTQRFVERGHKVVCFDLYPDYAKVSHLNNVEILTGNVTHIEDLIDAIRKYSVQHIVNLAYILPPDSEERLQLAVRVNLMGMNNVFEAARLMGIKRVIYASSIGVYGLQPSYGNRPVTEEDDCYPETVYTAHKLWNEFMARKYMERYDMIIPGLRIANVSGPGRTKGVSAWQGQCIDNVAIGKPATIVSRRDQKLLIIYVDDTAEIFAELCLAESLKYAVYNSLAYSVTAQEFVDKIKLFVPDADVTFDETAPDQPNIYLWSSDRVERDLGIQLPPIEEMIRRHIDEARRIRSS